MVEHRLLRRSSEGVGELTAAIHNGGDTMEIYDMPPRSRLNVTVKPIAIEIESDPYLVATRFGYAPMVTVKLINGGLEHSFLISSLSVTEALEKLRAGNRGKLSGLRVAVSRESNDQRAKYVIEPIE
jgi:hypothetical protein